jgi:Na+/melibiose symporter-like transporter
MDGSERLGLSTSAHRMVSYGSAYDSAGPEGPLTDGGAWTDVEALAMLRRQRHRMGSSSEDTLPMAPETPWALFASIGMIGFSVDFAWATMEAVIIPYLTDHLGASMQLASLIWVVNPVFGVFLQPLLGQVMDRCGSGPASRRPFVLGLGAIAVFGVLALLFLDTIRSELHLSTRVVIVLCFVFFGIADIAHDCLLIPGRVLIGDVAGPLASPPIYEAGHALFSGMQCGGHLAAEILGTIPLVALGLPSQWDAYHTLLTASALFLVCGCGWTSVKLRSRPPTPPSSPSSNEEGPLRVTRSLDLTTLHKGGKARRGPRAAFPVGVRVLPLLECQQRRRRWVLPLPEPFTADDKTTEAMSLFEVLEERAMVVLVLVLTCFGWISTSVISFYWTVWIGMDELIPGTLLRLSFTTLCIQALVSIVTSFALPYLNRTYGDLAVFIASQVVFAGAMVLAAFWKGPAAVVFLSIPLGIMPAIHPNNSLTICERLVDSPRLRASVISLVNTTMPLAQIIVGLCSGPVITYLSGDIASYFAFAGLLHGVTLAIAAGMFLIDRITD